MDYVGVVSSLKDLCYQHPVNMLGISACIAFLAGLLVGKLLSRTRPTEVRRSDNDRRDRGRPSKDGGGRGGRESRGRDRNDRDSREGSSGSSAELYVGNLPYEMTEQELAQTFEKFGKVVSARIISSRSSGSSKGYGFVEMGDVAAAKAARQGLDSEKIKGRRIVVSEAKSQPKMN